MRGLLAPLSPHEETALRLVSLGATPDCLSPRAVARLKQLDLVASVGDGLQLTPVGATRCDALCMPPKWNGIAVPSTALSGRNLRK